MSQMTSGQVLREARERKGYDMATVARRLRIRPDILRAIEAGDYEAMPPRGYTRNMINAYARLLGLNPTEIVNMYLDEVYAVQVERARDSSPTSSFNMERASRGGRNRSDERGAAGRAGQQASYSDTGYIHGSARGGRYSRSLYDDRTQFSRDDYGVTRERMARPGRSDRDFLSHHSGYSASDYEFRGNASGRAVHVGQTPMQYSASRLPGIFQSKFALGVAIAAIVLIVLVIVFLFIGNRNNPVEDDVSQLPVSGIKDTTGTADDDSQTGIVEVAPSSSHVVLTVKQGDECYLESYENNTVTPYNLVGPAQENIEVTGVLKIATWTPEFVTVTVDNNEVTLTSDDELGGMYSYTIDFPKNLEQWRSTHTSREAQRSAALATAGSNANQAESSQSAQAAEQENSQEEDESQEQEDEEEEEGSRNRENSREQEE